MIEQADKKKKKNRERERESKDIESINSKLVELDVMDKYGTRHPITGENTFLLSPAGIFTEIRP